MVERPPLVAQPAAANRIRIPTATIFMLIELFLKECIS
jgi:hypothetical protein